MSKLLSKQKTYSGYDLNNIVLPDVKLSEYKTLLDLCTALEIGEESMVTDYFWMGNRFEGDPKPIELVGLSEISNLHSLTVIRHEAGG